MPQAGMSSTPATAFRQRPQEVYIGGQSLSAPSWSASLESPLLRLAGEVQSLSQADEVSGMSERSDDFEDVTQRAIPLPKLSIQTHDRDVSSSKGKNREMPSPLLQGVLLRNTNLGDTTSPRGLAFSPLKLKPKTPVAKTKNPYLPPGSKPADWKGVVDLSDPSSTPLKGFPSPSLDRTARPTGQSRYAGEDSFESNFGMSPPVTMDFARLPKLGKTPRKEAAARIFQGLLDVEKRGVFAAPPASGTRPGGKGSAIESSGSSMPSPPSLSRYQPDSQSSISGSSIIDTSLERMMRQVGILSDSEMGKSQSSADGPSLRDQKPVQPPVVASSSIFPRRPPTFTAIQRPPLPVAPPPAPETPPPPQYDFRHLRDDELDGEMEGGGLDDSLDEDSFDAANPVFPHAAGDYDQDDSFASDDTDSFGDDGVGPAIEVYPAEGDSFEDDSFENEFDGQPEEETVFGVPPAERLRMQGRESEGNLRMYGADLLQDTLGVGSQMAQAGRVEDTPTPIIPPK